MHLHFKVGQTSHEGGCSTGYELDFLTFPITINVTKIELPSQLGRTTELTL